MRVLLVEDHPNTRLLLELELSDAGHTVRSAGTLEQAMDCIDQGGIDAVVTDLHLGDPEAGMDVLDYVRASSPHPVPVILHSGSALDDRRVELRERGFFDFVPKCTSVDGLIDALNRASR